LSFTNDLKGRLTVWFANGLTKDTWRRRILARIIVREANKMGKSWKTSAAGIGAILSALGLLAKALSDGDMAQVGVAITGIITGIGLLMARDNDKSSEDVGTK
jgi:hypothetical protein